MKTFPGEIAVDRAALARGDALRHQQITPGDEIGEFLLVDALERHGVELDLDTRSQGGIDDLAMRR